MSYVFNKDWQWLPCFKNKVTSDIDVQNSSTSKPQGRSCVTGSLWFTLTTLPSIGHDMACSVVSGGSQS